MELMKKSFSSLVGGVVLSAVIGFGGMFSPVFSAQDVVFDECHAQTAGNADWTATGGFSDLANVFKSSGYNVVSAKKTIDKNILANASILVMSEPNSVYTKQEQADIVDFVKRGGNLFAVADHAGADRNNDGIDAVGVLNQILPQFGIQFDANKMNEFPIPIDSSSDKLLEGCKAMGTWAGATVKAVSKDARVLVPSKKSPSLYYIGLSTPSNCKGRIVAFGDSSIFDDGTGAPGNKLYDGFNRKDCSHIQLTKNAIAFLEGNKNSREVSENTNAPVTTQNLALNDANVSRHWDPTHPGHSHQAPDGTMYHQQGDMYPGSPASYQNGYPSQPPVPPTPTYPSYPSTPTYPSYPSTPSYPSYPTGYETDATLYQAGFTYFNQNNFIMAIDSFKKLLKRYPASSYREGTMYYLALSYKSTYNYNDASKLLRDMINEFRTSPSRPDWFFASADVLDAAYKYADASRWLESFVREYPSHQRAAEAMFRAGQELEKAYKNREAADKYKYVVSYYPYSPFVNMSRERLAALGYGYGY